MFYDLIFLVLLIIILSFFLYKNRKRLGKEGALVLYRTQWGVKLIDSVGKKYKKTLKVLSFVAIGWGYVLMATMLWLFIRTVWEYLFNPEITQAIGSAPPVAPLIPYFPQLFGLSSFFPVFYATYFIVSILIVMTVHEFSHGIFARRYNIGIKSTGFVFLKWFPAVFGAFVEQDDKQMIKAKKFEQMSVLSAGVFANTITAIVFMLILILFFSFAFVPVGVAFANYAYSPIIIKDISNVNGINLLDANYETVLENMNEDGWNNITADGKKYIASKGIIEMQNDSEELFLFDDAPAIKSGLSGVVIEIDGVKIRSEKTFREQIIKHSPNDVVEIKTINNGTINSFEVVLVAHPLDSSKPYLGIVSVKPQGKFLSELTHFLSSIRQTNLYFKENVYYEARWLGVSEFFYYLFWWIVMINILVALFNMLPLGVLDGGRFFELTILGITRSKKTARVVFKIATFFLLFLIFAIIAKWLVGFVM